MIINTSKGAKRPYIEFTYDSSGNIVTAKLYGCTAIAPYQFYHQAYLESVDFSESPGLSKIGGHAFEGCTALVLTALPDSVYSFGGYVFSGCTSIVNMEIGAPMLGSGTANFYGCTGLENVWIRDSCQRITAPIASTAQFAECSDALKIYAEATAKPSGWGTYFNRTGTGGGTEIEVVYGQTEIPW